VAQPHVAAATVTGGHHALDQPDALEHVEVVGQQVASQAELSGQHRGGPVGHGELLDDRQPNRFTQRRVHGGTSLEQPVHEP
jgi:hypothetical protein